MTPRRSVATCLICCLVACLSWACERSEQAERADAARPPVLVIGFDGLEWSVMRPLLAAGELPHLRSLMERGSWGWLETFVPTNSPIVWTSIATGKAMDQHGITGFSDDQGLVFTSSRRDGKALWNIADDQGLTSNVLGWWVTWPVEPIRGLMVSATTAKSMRRENWKPALMPGHERQVHPVELTERVMAVAQRAGSEPAVRELARTKVFGDLSAHQVVDPEARSINQTMWSIQSDATYLALARDLLPDHPADLTMVYFGGPDVIGHRFWRQYSPDEFAWSGADPALDASLASAIPGYYRWADEMVGELLALAGEGADVFIISDHGMHAVSLEAPTPRQVTGHHPNGAPGVIIAAGPSIRRGADVQPYLDTGALRRVAQVFDITPMVLGLLDIPAGRDMQGQLRSELFTDEVRARIEALTRVPSHDVGFRPAFVEDMPPEMKDAFAERMLGLNGLGYLGGEADGAGRPVDAEGFVPDRTAPADREDG